MQAYPFGKEVIYNHNNTGKSIRHKYDCDR